MRPDHQPSAWVSISDYARTYGLSRSTVYLLLKRGALEHYRVLSVVRIKDAPPDRHQPKQPQNENHVSSEIVQQPRTPLYSHAQPI